MAAVYAATGVRGHQAALKILHPSAKGDGAARERFEREAWVARMIDHPCMVSVLDEGRTELDEPFLVMELLEGRSVEAMWRRAGNRLSAPLVLRILERALDVLACCHAQGIVHRDLKPSNLFVTSDARVKLLDFGVVQARGANPEHLPGGVVVGTPYFMAPEQAIGAWDQVDGRADIFAAGATMFALLSGQRLNQGATEADSFHLAATRAAPSLAQAAPGIDPLLVSLVDRALAWDKHARYADAASMRRRLLEVLERLDDGTSRLTAMVPRARERVSLRSPARNPAGRKSTGPPGGEPNVQLIPPAPGLPRELEGVSGEDAGPKVGRILTDAFVLMEQLLGTVLEHGFRHDELRSQLSAVHALLSRALRAQGHAIELKVFPFCLTSGELTVWEPGPPLDAVPHGLYAAGVRSVRLAPGLAMEEVRELLEVLMPDAGRLGAGHADVLGLEQIPHVELECVLMPMRGDGQQREEFIAHADAVECALRDALEQAAWEVEGASDEPAPYALKQATRMALQEWLRRRAESMVDDWELTQGSEDATDAWLALRSSAARGGGRGYQAIFLLHAQVRAALRERLAGRMESADILAVMSSVLGDEDRRALLQGASQLRAELLAGMQPWHELTPDEVLRWARDLLSVLGPESFNAVLEAIPGLAEAGVEEAAADFIARHAQGRELRLSLELPKQRARVAERLVGMLRSTGTEAAWRVLHELQSSPSAVLRMLAFAHAERIDDVQRREVIELLEDPDGQVRWAALKVAERHRLTEAGALAATKVSDSRFHEIPYEERELLLQLLAALQPDRCERLAIDMVSQHGIIGEQARSESRVLAASLLGATSASDLALAALRSASLPLWWNPPAVRQAATAAIASIRSRMLGAAGSEGS